MYSYGVPPTVPPNNAHQNYKPCPISSISCLCCGSAWGAPGQFGCKARRTCKDEGYGFLCVRLSMQSRGPVFSRLASNSAAQHGEAKIQTLRFASASCSCCTLAWGLLAGSGPKRNGTMCFRKWGVQNVSNIMSLFASKMMLDA